MRRILIPLLVLAGSVPFVLGQSSEVTPADELPSYITRITHFGQRADWSHDGKRILFLERTFGDVFEIHIESRSIRPISHHYYHEGYTRALYLSNGDIILSGAPDFDAEDPWPSRGENAELSILSKDLDKPPVPLGTKCSEGPAVSRKEMKIAWTIDHGDYPDELPEGAAQIWMADIVYEGETPKLINKKMILDSRDLPFESGLETQNFRPPDEKELIFSAYGYEGTEVYGVNIETGELTQNYSKSPHYEEPEGIYPSGEYTLVEMDRHKPEGVQYIDVYRLTLDGSGEIFRVTHFGDYPGFKGSNPVVSDDGNYIAFQMAKYGDPAGVGRGLFIYDIQKARAAGAYE
jgi:Tol biopolymer transport system component